MRNWKMALLLASALAAGPALAQDHGDHGHGDHGGGDHGGGGHEGGHGPGPQAPHGGPPPGMPHGGLPGGPGGGQPHFGGGGGQPHFGGGGPQGQPHFPTPPGGLPGGQGGYRGPLPNSPSHPSGYQPGGPNRPDSPSHPSGYQPGGPNRPLPPGGGGFDPGRHVGGQPQGGVNVWRGQHGGPGGGYDGHGGPGFDGRGGPPPGHGFAGRGGPGGGYRPDHGDWNRGWRDDHRYDWQGWRDSHRSIYRLGRYNPPGGYGWGYRRFGIGAALPGVFFAENYWIGDPGYYRLPPAYGPYRWVRYYNDALLIDIESGEVVDAIPDFFY